MCIQICACKSLSSTCIHTCTHTHTHTHVHADTQTQTHVHTRTHTHSHTHILTHTHTHIHTHVHTQLPTQYQQLPLLQHDASRQGSNVSVLEPGLGSGCLDDLETQHEDHLLCRHPLEHHQQGQEEGQQLQLEQEGGSAARERHGSQASPEHDLRSGTPTRAIRPLFVPIILQVCS